jgi:hypothetical protein
MVKRFYSFSIFKFDQLLGFEECNIVITNALTWTVLWLLNAKSYESMFALSHNHSHPKENFKSLFFYCESLKED